MIWLAQFSIFVLLFSDAWRNRVAADLCRRKGFRSGPLLDVHGSLQLLLSFNGREVYKALLRFVPLWLVVSGRVFLLVEFVVSLLHVDFVGLLIMMVICSGNVPFLLSLRSVKILSFTIFMRMDKVHWPRCLFALAWLVVYAFRC